MGKIQLLFTLLTFVHQLTIKVDAREINYVGEGCVNTDSNYTHGSTYGKNLNLLFTNLTSKSSSLMFYNSTIGDDIDLVYGIFQCRNDLSHDVCSACVKDATRKIVQKCPSFGEAIVWYYECMLRYANRDIFSSSEKVPSMRDANTGQVSDHEQFAEILVNAMDGVIKTASSGSPHFASSQTDMKLKQELYSFAQCTPDIDSLGCNTCLKSGLYTLINCCSQRIQGAVMLPSCQLRFDSTPFLNVQSPLAHDKGKTSLKTGIIAAIAASASIGLVVLSVGLWLIMGRRKPKDQASNRQDGGYVEFVRYDFGTLKTATGDFSSDNMLGEGGFGVVYKGTLQNGQELAIKRLSGTSGQGANEFTTEAHLLAKLQHKNLVRLVGCCSEGDEKLLVYEFLPNTSLDRFLCDPEKRALFDWGSRHKIIMGISRGLQYLHEDSRLTIIHRDLKPGNILLDKDMNAKIADFGMAKLFEKEQQLGSTSRIVGTYGYMAPEYMITGHYSDKSDVYSFGIIVLEIISGQKNRVTYPTPREDLSVQAWRLWSEGRSFELTDPALQNNCSINDVERCIQIGLLCLQEDAEERPTMTSVVYMLNGSVELPLPSTAVVSRQPLHMSMAFSDSTTKSATSWADTEQDLYPGPR